MLIKIWLLGLFTKINEIEKFNMEDFQVLVGILASSSFAINLYLIKSVARLFEKVARLEGKLSKA